MERWEISNFIQGCGMQSKSNISLFLLMLFKGTKRKDWLKIFCMTPSLFHMKITASVTKS